MVTSLRDRIAGERLYIDGAMGTMLMQAGLPAGQAPEQMNLTQPQAVLDIHRAYVAAGCDILTANTFGCNPRKAEGDWAAALRAGIALARQAADEAAGAPRYVALDVGPTGQLLAPSGALPFEAAYDAFACAVREGAAAGADLVLIETMSDAYELKAAVLAAKENCALPVIATVTLDEAGRLLTGADIATVAAILEGLRVDALGVNCASGPEALAPFVRQLVACASLPVVVSPNAGVPTAENPHGASTPEEFAAGMRALAQLGVQILGGCCGTTPAHIRALRQAVDDVPYQPARKKRETVVCSGSDRVVLGAGRPVVIGERINPTGKKKMKEALHVRDMDYLLGEAAAQRDCGAEILDVNVGLPGLDEREMMLAAVRELQAAVRLPLQLDSADPAVLEAALRAYNGKAMINSVSGKEESMRAVFPLAAKYGGVLVALTLDEGGIPPTAEGRLRVAEKIVRTAAEYGIDRRDIVVDTLTLAASSGEREALITLEALRLCREKLGVATVLGVSNISFGLPQRERVSAAFLTMALAAGLDCAIVNPCSDAMMSSYRSYCALAGADPDFAGYLAAYAGAPAAAAPAAPAAASAPSPAPASSPAAGNDATIRQLILDGRGERADRLAQEALADRAPMDIINEELIPALEEVGREFERGRIFLPQLLKSAQAAQQGFAVLRDYMRQHQLQTESHGKVLIATVKGDIHDIGKNIAKVLLENFGFEVIDLGRDVPPEKIVETVQAQDIPVVGLSALMTTTAPAMAETIRQLRAAGCRCKVFVAGAVVTQDYADQIGADAYVKDAMGSVEFARSVLCR